MPPSETRPPASESPPADPGARGRRMLRGSRQWISRHRRIETAYRAGVGAIGGILTVGGLILVPLPGPGWLVVFAGLALLGTEFVWAHRAAAALKRLLQRFWSWWQARRARGATTR